MENISTGAAVISAICAVIGIPLALWGISKRKGTKNIIKRGSGNKQISGVETTKNEIRDGDNNIQGG